ncbi:HEAT repeat domain-containing protein, partial [bacterium]|nr:HEAT repeat domain-containing protein [bacterium]
DFYQLKNSDLHEHFEGDEPSFVVEYAVSEGNVLLAGRFLAGEAGELAKEASQRCVQKLIDSTDEAKRILGIKSLSGAGDEPFAVKTLLEIVSKEERSLLEPSEDEEALDDWPRQTHIQQVAQSELGKLIFRILNPDVIDLLRDVTHHSPAARMIATTIIGRSHNRFLEEREKEWIIQFLAERLDDPRWRVRLEAVECLADMVEPQDRRIIELLHRVVESAERWGNQVLINPIVQGAYEALVRIGEIKHEPDPDRISRQIAWALSALENKDTEFGASLAVSRVEPLVTIQRETEEVIKALGNERYEKLLILSLSREPQPNDDIFARGLVIFNLGIIGSDLAIQPLIKHLGSFDVDSQQREIWDMRCDAAKSLVQIGSVAAMQALVDLLSDEELIPRLMAAIALEIAKQNREAWKSLMAIQFNAANQRTAVESCLTGKAGIKTIQYISHLRGYSFDKEGNESGIIQDVILNLLNMASSDIVIDAALRALDNEQSKACAIWVLGELGDRSVLSQLRSKLSDLDVHSEVNQAIQKIIQRSDNI